MKKTMEVEAHQIEDGDTIVTVHRDPTGTFRQYTVERDVPDWEPNGEGWQLLSAAESIAPEYEAIMHRTVGSRNVWRRWHRPPVS